MENVASVLIEDKTLTRLAGYPFGRELYKENIAGKIDLFKPFIIKFPDQIDYLAASFIVGFFGEIYNQIGMEGIKKNMTVDAKISNYEAIEKTLLTM